MTTMLVSEIFPPRTGGSGRWFFEIYRRLPQGQFLVAAGEHPEAHEFDSSQTLPIQRLPLALSAWGLKSFTGLRGYFRAVRQLRRSVKQRQVTMIHCGRCLPEGFVAYLLSWWTGTPYGCFVHGEDVTTAATSRELSWMIRRVFGRARFVIANSRSTRQILLDQWRLPEDKVRLLYPGCDTQRFVPVPRSEEARRQLGWQDRQVILTVGRLQKRKGHDMLIAALPIIQAAIPNVFYSIIGDGEERATLEALATRLGVRERVQFQGETTDTTLAQAYQQCDLFALPNRTEGSDIEGFGMVLVEAQACGRPVLAGDSGGTAETMKQRETGRIVDCTKPEPLAAALIDLLSDPQRLDAMGSAGRHWVVSQFDWTELAKQAAQLFAKV